MPYGIVGWINDQEVNLAHAIIRRSPEIDALLTEAGYNPSEVNCATTPLVGASEYARITVLIMVTAGEVPGAQRLFANSASDIYSTTWELYLSEPGDMPNPETFYSITNSNPLDSPLVQPHPRFFVEFEQDDTRGDALTGLQNPNNVEQQRPTDEPINPRPTAQVFGQGGERKRRNSLVPQITQDAIRQQMARSRASLVGDNTSGGNDPDTTTGSETGTDAGTVNSSNAVEPLNNTPSRHMYWMNLLPISIRELKRSAGNAPATDLSGRPRPNDDALFVVEFVDYRYALQSLYGGHGYGRICGAAATSDRIRDEVGRIVIGGMMTGTTINMLAEAPNAFECQTVNQSWVYPPNVNSLKAGLFSNSGFLSPSIKASEVPIENTAFSYTYVQQPYSLQEILEQLAATVDYMTRGLVLLSTESWDNSREVASEQLFDYGDIVNLDFRGMTIAQALDTLAQRLGAAWVWDRSASMLILQLVAGNSAEYGVPDNSEWFEGMEQHRVAGYLNTLTLDIPRTVILLHETQYCTALGPSKYAGIGDAESLDKVITYAHLVDARSATNEGGYLSTELSLSLNSRASMLWHCSVEAPAHLSIDIKDHIPALIGSYSPPGQQIFSLPGSKEDIVYRSLSQIGSPGAWYGFHPAIGNRGAAPSGAGGLGQYQPWNYSDNTTPMALIQLPGSIPVQVNDGYWGGNDERISPEQNDSENPRFTFTLAGRKQIYELRMSRLRGVCDGDMTCNRMPPRYWYGKQRAHTPSVGLQYDRVEFGFDSEMTVRYRIYGKNTHPILYPSGAKIQRFAGGPSVHSATYNGVTTVSVRRPVTNSIKRAFPCRFEAVRNISTSFGKSTNPNNYFFIWLYKFVEVTPDIDASRMFFAQQDVLGWGRAEGYALNLCEMHFANERPPLHSAIAPMYAFDGTELQLQGQNGARYERDIIRPTDPRGYCICYEMYNRSGLSSYYIFAPNGVEVFCASPASNLTDNPWQYMGVSGVAQQSGDIFAGDIMGA